jgi:hypothetical protein
MIKNIECKVKKKYLNQSAVDGKSSVCLENDELSQTNEFASIRVVVNHILLLVYRDDAQTRLQSDGGGNNFNASESHLTVLYLLAIFIVGHFLQNVIGIDCSQHSIAEVIQPNAEVEIWVEDFVKDLEEWFFIRHKSPVDVCDIRVDVRLDSKMNGFPVFQVKAFAETQAQWLMETMMIELIGMNVTAQSERVGNFVLCS